MVWASILLEWKLRVLADGPKIINFLAILLLAKKCVNCTRNAINRKYP